MAARRGAEGMLATREWVAALAERYGALLTARQRELVQLYYVEDLSLAEVAERASVSRQAVHDLLRRARAGLAAYEARLGLLAADQRRHGEAVDLLQAVRAARHSGIALQRAEELARRLVED